MYSHASILAFLYAGAVIAELDRALEAKTNGAPLPEHFENWEGHRGFLHYAEPLAQSIADYLNEVDDELHDEDSEVFHPGVVEYELIEPLGDWLLTAEQTSPCCTQLIAQAFDKFKTDYKAWLTKE